MHFTKSRRKQFKERIWIIETILDLLDFLFSWPNNERYIAANNMVQLGVLYFDSK